MKPTRRSIMIRVPEHIREFVLNMFGTDNYVCPDLDSFLGRMLQLSAEKTNTVKLRKKDIIPENWVEVEFRVPNSLADYDFSDYTIRNMGNLLHELFKLMMGTYLLGGKNFFPKDQTHTTNFLELTGTMGYIDTNTARKMGVNLSTFMLDKKRRQFSRRDRKKFEKI